MNSKRKPTLSIDCTNPRVSSTTLPSIKIENSTPSVTAKTSREDSSSAKQKRASFHSGANRAFLEPIRSSTELKWNSINEKVAQQKPTTDIKNEKGSPIPAYLENKDHNTGEKTTITRNASEAACGSIVERIGSQKTIVDGRSDSTIERNSRSRTVVENKELQDDKTIGQRTNKAPSTMKRIASANSIVENKDGRDRIGTTARNEVRCSSVNERNPPSLKKTTEYQKIDQKSRRTSSAPPQRHLVNSSTSNRVQVNIVIEASGTPTSERSNDHEKTNTDCKDNLTDRVDTVPKVR